MYQPEACQITHIHLNYLGPASHILQDLGLLPGGSIDVTHFFDVAAKSQAVAPMSEVGDCSTL
jgi:hypothetical protein